ncbi:MAG: hypothetical protein ABSH48_19530 [Verrucomicrobiota bacterium]|jgi:hypothetical protein
MKKRNLYSQIKKVSFGAVAGVLAPGAAFGCACGCGVFEVGTSSMLPEGPGGMGFLTYAFQDQNQNWSDSSKAPAANNDDKEIRTDFMSAGLQYFFNSSWGVEAELPFAYRNFKTVTANPNVPAGTLATINWFSLGDVRIHAIYTGFSPDLSSGLDLGLRLPTGSFSHENAYDDVDRDSEIGSGSTDILLGGFHRGNLGQNQNFGWFAQAEADLPMLTQADYRPGFELDAAAGVDYHGFSLGRLKISPLAQVIVSERTRDLGNDAAGGANDGNNGKNSGYTRVLLSPAIEFHLHPVLLYADVEVPVFAHVTGNQLVAPILFKVNLSYMF